MFETIWKGLTGRWVILAIMVAASPTGRKLAKTAAKEIVRATIVAGEKVRELTEELREEGSDLLAEVRDEHHNGSSPAGKSKKKSVSEE